MLHKIQIREIQEGFFFKFKGSWFDNPRATSYLPNDDYAAAQQEIQEDALYTIPGYIPEYGSTDCRVLMPLTLLGVRVDMVGTNHNEVITL